MPSQRRTLRFVGGIGVICAWIAAFLVPGLAAAAPGDPAFVTAASGLVQLGADNYTVYAATADLKADKSVDPPAKKVAGFVIVRTGTVALVDNKTKAGVRLEEGDAAFVRDGETAKLTAVGGDAQIWRIAVVTSSAAAPLTEGDGVSGLVVARGAGDKTAGEEDLRSVTFELGSIPGGGAIAIGDPDTAVALAIAIAGDITRANGKGIAEGEIAPRPAKDEDGAVELRSDSGAIVGVVTVGPALDPAVLGTADSAAKPTPTPLANTTSSNSGNTTTNNGGNTNQTDDTDNTDNTDDGLDENGDQIDTDGDGISDAGEIKNGTDRLSTDTDQDGLNDFQETFQTGTNPTNPDTDGDGLTDGLELMSPTVVTNPLLADTDDDQLSDGQELARGTNPLDGDSDEDGIIDGWEISTTGTNPLNADTDGDGLPDGNELNIGSDPNTQDEDGDLLSDYYEWAAHGDPHKADTDGDGFQDNVEYAAGTSLTDPNSHP